MVKPKDLPIYAEPESKYEYQLVPPSKSVIEPWVSVVRTQVWKWSDKCQGAIDKTKQAYTTTEKKTKDVVDFIKTEENLAPRAAVIGLAGLTGVVLARKGGLFRKLFYSSTLMAGTASLCYPYQAVRIAKTEWEWVNEKTGVNEIFQKTKDKVGVKKSTKSEKLADTAAPSTSESVKSEDTTTKSTSNSPTVDESLVDHGQSNPEDKDMYSTRS
ncbi:MICOS complex subunit MIC27-like isoform X2 [Amphiura filiformis]